MNIQSMSIVVPAGGCWNHCAFCVSRMHKEEYGRSILGRDNVIPRAYLDRMEFVRDEGCNSLILTGTSEPQQNLPFIYALLQANRTLRKPFYNITIQTTGTALTPDEIGRLARAGVTTLAVSLSAMDDEQNWAIIHAPEKVRTMKTVELIRCAKDNGMNVRVCFNLTNAYTGCEPEDYFRWASGLAVDQVTFRKIYADGSGEESAWVHAHEFPQEKLDSISAYVRTNGTAIARLPFNFIKYSVHGISTVVDDNCMSKDNIDDMKYAILRPNGHLYSRWDDTGSLIF